MKKRSERFNQWAVFVVLASLTAGLLYIIKLAGVSADPHSSHQLNWLGQVLMLIVGMATMMAFGVLQLLLFPTTSLNPNGSKSKSRQNRESSLSEPNLAEQGIHRRNESVGRPG